MALKDEIEQDIKSFYDQIETQNVNDKIGTLRLLLSKYAHLSTTDFMMDKNDFDSIMSEAKGIFIRKSMPVRMMKSTSRDVQLEPTEQTNMCVIEASVSFFKKNDCLKRLPVFKVKDSN